MIPEFHMTVGIPGVGKSTWAKSTGISIHSSDNIRNTTGGTNEQVFEEMRRLTIEYLKMGKSCIYDATNLSRKRRVALIQNICKIPCYKVCDLFIEPIEICREQNNSRSGIARVPEEVIDRMLRSFQVPMIYEGFDDIIIHQRKRDTTDYISLMKDFVQDNRHHTLNLLDHSKKACSFIMKHNIDDYPKILLGEAALYHDIGKLFTKDFHDIHGNETEDAHYYGHDNYGAYLYLTLQKDLNNTERLYIANLINWHMAPYMSWASSERARKRDKERLGYMLYDHIMLLHEADEYAH